MTVWEVFARKAYEEPLHHVGAVTEDDEDLALVSARSIYDGGSTWSSCPEARSGRR